MAQSAPDAADPRRAEPAIAEAKAAADSGDFDGARAALVRALDARSNDPSLHALMAWYTHQSLGLAEHERNRLAEHHLQVALELDPQNAQAHYYQGMIWATDGNATRGRISLNTALRIQPDFSAAVRALESLNGRADETPAPVEARSPRPSPPSRRRSILVATFAVVLGGGAAFLFLGGRDAALDSTAAELGTRLTLISVSKVNRDLYLDAGSSWRSQADADRAQEMATIAQKAQGLGYENVFVFSNSQAVAESHGGAVCFGDGCGVQMAAQKAKGASPHRANGP
jgi:tetratricopeptide (TPR) repeat protein